MIEPEVIEIDPEDSGREQCEYCDDTAKNERALQIHKGVKHKAEYAREKTARLESKADEKAAAKEDMPQQPKPTTKPKRNRKATDFIAKGGKFSKDGEDLFNDLLAAGVAWMAIQWLGRQRIPLTKAEKEVFIPEPDLHKAMFNPIIGLSENVSPVVVVINTLADKMDYLQCAMAWKDYYDFVTEFAQARAAKLEENNGTLVNGPEPTDAVNLGGFPQGATLI